MLNVFRAVILCHLSFSSLYYYFFNLPLKFVCIVKGNGFIVLDLYDDADKNLQGM